MRKEIEKLEIIVNDEPIEVTGFLNYAYTTNFFAFGKDGHLYYKGDKRTEQYQLLAKDYAKADDYDLFGAKTNERD